MTSLSKWLPFKFRRKPSNDNPPPAKRQGTGTATPERAELVHPMQRMFDSMLSDRFWRDPFSMLGMMGRQMDDFFGDFSPQTFRPTIDMVDEGKSLRVSAELPGMSRDDIELQVGDGVLTLSGVKKTEEESKEEGCYRVERSFGRFERTIPLPADVDAEHAEATFDKGVLNVRFPKTNKHPSARKIPLK